MIKILATMKKEWLLLWRDKIGLIILFVLPMCLVLFISLTTTEQGDTKQQKLKVVYLDQDHGDIAKGFKKALDKVSLFNVVVLKDESNALDKAKTAVTNGDYQFAVVVPAKTTQRINDYLKKEMQHAGSKQKLPNPIQLYLDPGMQAPVKNGITTALAVISAQLQTATVVHLMGQVAHQPKFALDSKFIDVKTHFIDLNDNAKSPNSVQYNVPAWTLFGMFFIVIPLAGVMVRERELGVHQRLEIAPVWHLELMLGRIFAFVGLNLVQLWLMLAVGVYVLPLFDMPTLEIANHVGLIFATGICASLAATGFGLLIGTWASTYEQATVLGPFLIVIAAAVGGIMAPVDLMPSFLQKISGLSPLNWAESAFLDIFVRNASFHKILPDLLKLLGFFVLTLVLSLSKFLHPRRLFVRQ